METTTCQPVSRIELLNESTRLTTGITESGPPDLVVGEGWRSMTSVDAHPGTTRSARVNPNCRRVDSACGGADSNYGHV